MLLIIKTNIMPFFNTEVDGRNYCQKYLQFHLLVDKTILPDCRKRHKNLRIAWIDYKKAYMVPHSMILENLNFCKCLTTLANVLKDHWQISKHS